MHFIERHAGKTWGHGDTSFVMNKNINDGTQF